MTPTQIRAEAEEAGSKAGLACTPTAMIIRDSATGQTYTVDGGCCGFASVNIKGTSAFARFLKKAGIGRKSYYGGYDIPCHAYGQSMEQKEAYCQAYAQTLNDYGIDAVSSSRMD